MQDTLTPKSPLEELKARLAQPTEEKPLPVVDSAIAPEASEYIEEVEEPTIVKKILTTEMLQSEVEIGIGFIDFTQNNLFRVGVNYKRKRKLVTTFGETALERAEILANGGVNKDEQTETDKAILKVQKKVDEVLEGLPFSDSEVKALRPLLEKYIINNDGKLPENFFAYMGLIQIFGGRLLNVLML